MGAPQRDLAELLAFVLPEARRARRLRAAWSNTASCYNVRQPSISIAENGNAASARRCANCWSIVCASYAMVDRIRAQSFLPRVVRGWNNLFHHYPWVG